jgi:ADP-heptose:LPS heptosyltransferase
VVRRIGVYVDLDLVGDALIKLPFVAALRAAWPGAEIVWIAGVGPSAFGRGLAPLVEGLLDRVLEGTGVGDGLRRALGETRLDLLIDTQSTVATALALRRLGARRFVSAAAWGLVGVPPQVAPRAPRHLVRRLLALLERASGRGVAETFGLRLPAAIAAQAAGLLPAGEDYVALVLGAGGKHKVWPEAQHVGLARALLAEGRVPVFILGPDERDRHADLAAAVPGARFPLQEAGEAPPVLTIALGARCVGAVAADCGGGHMMAASGVPLVSLFGPTDPAKFAPWAATSRVLRAQAFGGTEMAAIPVAAVRAALDAIARGPVA